MNLSQRAIWAGEQAISFLMQQAVENRDCLSLAAGLVDEQSLPVDTTRVALGELFADDDRARSALQYGTTAGADGLRASLLRHLERLESVDSGGLRIDVDQIVATTGSQQFLAALADVLFDPGDICLVAAPTYFVFLGVLDGIGARTIPVKTDDDGMCPDALEECLQQLSDSGELHRVKLIYLVSYYENPSGVSLSADRREAMVGIAQKWSTDHRIRILEDAAYRELRYDGPDLPSVWSFDSSGETVILTQTFSKSYSPGIRVGFGVVPTDLVKPICDRKGNEDFGSANLNQFLLATVLDSGRYEPHVQFVCDSYRVKRDAMVSASAREFGNDDRVSWIRPEGGLYVWMSLPNDVGTGFDSELFRVATHDEKVMYVPGELCFAGPVNERPVNHMRLSFGVLPTDRIDEAITRLACAIRTIID